MREAGAVMLGKTTTPEMAWKGVTDSPLTGITRNPWDPSKTAGGSSGGSAAAVAAGMGALARRHRRRRLGADPGRVLPASSRSSRPTAGSPLYPASPFGTLSHAGPMARTVDDTALLLDVLSPARPPRPVRAGAAGGGRPRGRADRGRARRLIARVSPTLG